MTAEVLSHFQVLHSWLPLEMTAEVLSHFQVLHSRPAAEMSLSTHPSLLRPAAIFADNVPFSFLTPEFIKTSQLLQNSVYDSCQARCFLAVGLFDIADSLASHLTLLRETLTYDPTTYLHVLLMTVLQLLSAMSHCLDRGFTVTETDLGDVFHIARQDLWGKVMVSFIPPPPPPTHSPHPYNHHQHLQSFKHYMITHQQITLRGLQ